MKEVQIVPDYNPLDDVLHRRKKARSEDVTRQLHTKGCPWDFGRRQEVYSVESNAGAQSGRAG